MVTDTGVQERTDILLTALKEHKEACKRAVFAPESQTDVQEYQDKELHSILYDYTMLSANRPIQSDMTKASKPHRQMIYKMLCSMFPSLDGSELINTADSLFVLLSTPEEETTLSEELGQLGSEEYWSLPVHLSYFVKAYNCSVLGIDVKELVSKLRVVRSF